AGITVSVGAHGNDYRSTLELLSRRANAVAQQLASFESGIERTETARLNVYPEFDQKKTEKVRHYIGYTTTSVSVHDFSVLSDLVVSTSSIDLVTINGPWWRLRTDSDVYRRARLAAADDALRRARDYAAAFGARITGLIEIADEGMAQQDRRPMNMAMAGATRADEGLSFDFQPQVQRVGGGVEARFTLSEPEFPHE
ncbi:MAG: SIMPL domain-containing protein, partial [Nocardioidaceae bacterium]